MKGVNLGKYVLDHADGALWLSPCHRIRLDKSAKMVYHTFRSFTRKEGKDWPLIDRL